MSCLRIHRLDHHGPAEGGLPFARQLIESSPDDSELMDALDAFALPWYINNNGTEAKALTYNESENQ